MQISFRNLFFYIIKIQYMTFQDGIILFKSGDYDAAADHFLQVTKEEKENHKAWNALGTCLSILGEYDDANNCFKNAVHLQPNNETYKNNLIKNDLKRDKEEDIFSLDDEPDLTQKINGTQKNQKFSERNWKGP